MRIEANRKKRMNATGIWWWALISRQWERRAHCGSLRMN
jgi:hypothetical protein